jgi:undecaprenyl diphosphate synthase
MKNDSDSDQYGDLIEEINKNNLPLHIAVIMDGNGRWAKKNNKKRTDGHRAGVESARIVAETCARIGIKYLTFYTFSTENWKRPKFEVKTLMDLLYKNILNNKSLLMDNDIKLKLLGDYNKLPILLKKELRKAIELSKNNKTMQINMALNYGGRSEILQAVRKIISDGISKDAVDDKLFKKYLYTGDIPDPDLLIRTSGELRISNFLLYQIAYSELYFSERYWPEFREEELLKAIINYQKRKRRYGKV